MFLMCLTRYLLYYMNVKTTQLSSASTSLVRELTPLMSTPSDIVDPSNPSPQQIGEEQVADSLIRLFNEQVHSKKQVWLCLDEGIIRDSQFVSCANSNRCRLLHLTHKQPRLRSLSLLQNPLFMMEKQ